MKPWNGRNGMLVNTTLLIFIVLLLIIIVQGGQKLSAQTAESRVALVVGNGDYNHIPSLRNPVNDARDIAQQLQGLGFEVIHLENANRQQMFDAIQLFGETLSFSNDIGLFYFAGHGLEITGKNFLLPVDVRVGTEDEIEFTSIPFELVLSKVRKAGNRANLFFLDACRDNPMPATTRSLSASRGLSLISAPPQSLIVYATDPGQAALDGDGSNSPFTAALLQHIGTPNMDVELILRNVRSEVISQTSGRQTPWTNSSLTESIVLATSSDIAESVELYLTTTPAGATIKVDGKNLGISPLFLDNLPRHRKIVIEAEYEGGLYVLHDAFFETDDLFEIHLQLFQQYGNVIVQGPNPENLLLSFDGKSQGNLEHSIIRNVPAGNRIIELRGNGISFTSSVEIIPGRTVSITPEFMEWGWVTLELPRNTTAELIDEDGKRITIVKHNGKQQVPIGLYQVDIHHGWLPHWKDYLPKSLTVNRGDEHHISLIALTPRLVAHDVAKVSAGIHHTVFITRAGEVFGSGRQWNGDNAQPFTELYGSEGFIPITNAASIAAGEGHTMIIKNDSSLWGVGQNRGGQVGIPGPSSYSTPVKVMEEVKNVFVSSSPGLLPAGFSMILTQDDGLWITGYNELNIMNSDFDTTIPRPHRILDNVVTASSRNAHLHVVKSDGSLWSVGRNSSGQLGDGTTTNTSTLEFVMPGVASVAAGGQHTIILMNDGTAWGVGLNSKGQLGDGTTENHREYIHIMDEVVSIEAGWNFSMFLKSDGSLWVCGDNWLGQLGDGTTQTRLSPVKIMDDVVSFSAGYNHACIIDQQGRLWVTGDWQHLGVPM